jgi:hypothetical protein
MKYPTNTQFASTKVLKMATVVSTKKDNTSIWAPTEGVGNNKKKNIFKILIKYRYQYLKLTSIFIHGFHISSGETSGAGWVFYRLQNARFAKFLVPHPNF